MKGALTGQSFTSFTISYNKLFQEGEPLQLNKAPNAKALKTQKIKGQEEHPLFSWLMAHLPTSFCNILNEGMISFPVLCILSHLLVLNVIVNT